MAVRMNNEGRNGEIWYKYAVRGWSVERLAEEYNLSSSRISSILANVRKSIPEPDRKELVLLSIEMIRHCQDKALAIVEMAGAPVAVGKDGNLLYDPDTGEVVRDYGAQLKALTVAMDAGDRIAKRLGLDAATKIESSTSVRYEIVGVDDDALS